MVKIGRQKNRPNTLVYPAPVGRRTLAEKVYSVNCFPNVSPNLNDAQLINYTLAEVCSFSGSAADV